MGHGGLTEQETIRFLQELLVIYEDSNFQEQLHRLHRTGAPRHALQLLAEAPGREALLRRFGFCSLAEMKGCVRLHVARGSQRVAKLAQLTRSSLGLEVPIESAEQLLERQYKETQEALRCDRLGRAPLSARCQCLQRIEAELSEAQAEELKRLPEDLPLQE
ncbi:unnamed protein product [Effrenium voratum]|nr:unnamed protein product [Effrenium voratum]